MKVLGREIGDDLEPMFMEITSRVRTEAELDLKLASFTGELSRVEWGKQAVTIYLHKEIPTHAVPHVLGVALQHVRQKLDRYPEVKKPVGDRTPEGPLVRNALRELVLAPEAESHLATLNLDQDWEIEQRHEGLKQLLEQPPEGWTEPGSVGEAFLALQYARFELQHPEKLWGSLSKRMEKSMPHAVERGQRTVRAVRRYRWSSPGACVQALVAARHELELERIALIEDPRTGHVG